MEENKEQAERCLDMGKDCLRNGDLNRASKMLKKSLQLYPLPGVAALLTEIEQKAQKPQAPAADNSTRNSSSGSATSSPQRPSAASNTGNSTSAAQHTTNRRSNTNRQSTAAAAAPRENAGADGRAYTSEQVEIVKSILRAKEGGRGAHYRILGLNNNASEAEIKKAYRKLSLKVHPDKNSAPNADDAFKAVGLAYATLSDSQKRHIYDRYGEEDPDNRGGAAPRGTGMQMNGQDVSPEEIFNMFFGGGGMGNGFHVYSTGFGGAGPQFRGGQARQRRGRGAAPQQQRGQGENPGFGVFLQLLPILLIAIVSFMNTNQSTTSMPGEGTYFSLSHKDPFIHPLSTRLTKVKDIPYYVKSHFLKTYNRNPFQLGQVEEMVERAYEQFLIKECNTQVEYKRRLQTVALQETDEEARMRKSERANTFELSRCTELDDLFPRRRTNSRR